MFIKKAFGKSSQKFYKRILIFTSFSLFILVGILTALFAFFSNRQIEENIKTFETGRAQSSVIQSSDCFEQIVSYIYYISEIQYIPMDQLDTSGKLWQQRIFSNNITAIERSNSHILGINVSNRDFKITNFTDSDSITSEKKLDSFLSAGVTLLKKNNSSFLCFEKKIPESGLEIKVFLDTVSLSNIILDDDCFLINSDGTIALSKNSEIIGKNLFKLYGFKKEDFKTEKKETFFYKNKNYISAASDSNSDMLVCTVIPKARYSSIYRNYSFRNLTLGIIFWVFAIIVVFYFINQTYSPIRKTVETFKYHLPFELAEYEDDIKYINDSIEATLKNNENLSTKLNENILKLNQAQAQMLQMQISPHFVMNTIENVKQTSVEKLGIDNPIETSLVQLSEIISQGIRQNDIFSTIKNEIELSKCYLSLMQNRFRNPFSVLWDVDEKILDCIIIRFTLQPLLENVFSHGFHPRRTNQWIKTVIKPTGENILISVSNNGKEISANDIKTITESLKSNDDLPHKHIGLKNIHLRCKLLFGENYGITDILSNQGITTIKLLIPKRKK